VALTLTAKPSGADYTYTYTVPVAEGDSLASYTLVATDCVILADESSGNDIIFMVSGGVDGTSGVIELEALTGNSEVLPETLYIPITATQAGPTKASGVIEFALRKVFGNGASIDAAAGADALERLNDMVAFFEVSGASVGCPMPLEEGTDLLIPSWKLQALKYGLTVRCAEHYGRELTGDVLLNARTGLQQLKHSNLPADRVGTEYY
jgi:hypothetical protein